jgi:nucleoside-diphosphate-sugar epimerase
MSRALVIGGGGYIGRRLASRLLGDNWNVASLELKPREPQREEPHGEIKRFYGLRDNKDVLAEALAGEPDVVFDLIAYRPVESRALVDLGATRFGRLVHLSTVSVYREFPETGAATEETAVRFEDMGQGYGPNKAACERVLEAAGGTGFPYVILRAAQIMGPGDPCSRQGYFVRRILNSQSILHPGPQDGLLWLLFIDDLIDGLIRAGTAPVLGRVFHLAQADAPSLRKHVEALAHGLGRPAPEILSPGIEQLMQRGFRIHGFAFARTVSVPPDTTAAQEALGWQCTSNERAVATTIADLLGGDHKSAYTTWPGRDTTQARLSGAHEWIHAAREARVLAGLTTPPGAYADTVLQWMSDDPFGPSRPELVESERWSSFLGGGPPPCRSVFATMPAELVNRLARSGCAWRPSNGLKESGSDGWLPDLVSAVELDKWTEDRLWVFSSSPSPSLPHYGITSEPQQVDLVSLARGLSMDAGSAERFLLEIRSADDAAALAQFLRSCLERRCLRIDDLARWGRLYIAGVLAWTPFDIRRQHFGNRRAEEAGLALQDLPWQDHIVPTSWILTNSVARLLCRTGLEGAATVRMGFEAVAADPEDKLPASAAVCWVGARTVVADLATDRVIEVAPAIAEALCVGA